MRHFAVVAFVTIACGAVTVHAQTLMLAYSKGAIYHYTVHTTSDFSIVAGAVSSPLKSDMRATETVTVDSVDSSGVANVSVTVTNVSLTSTVNIGNGLTTSTTTMPALPPVSLKMAPDGLIVSVNVTARSTYLRDELFHGVQAAVVETASTTTINLGSKTATPTSTVGLKATETSDATSWIDPASHRLLKTLATSSDEMTISAGGPTGSALPGLAGPFSLKGKQTLDLEPA